MITMLWLCVATGWAGRAQSPPLAPLLEQAGWQPTPGLSADFRPGRVFESSPDGLRLQIADCFSAQAARGPVPAELPHPLPWKVQVDLGISPVGPIVAQVSFGAPMSWSIPAPVPSRACLDALRSAWARGLDLGGLHAVREVLVASVTAQTCGRMSPRGRFQALSPAEASQIPGCARRTLEPVTLAYRTAPVLSLPGLFEPSAEPASAAQATPALPFDRFLSELERLTDDYARLAELKRMESMERLEELLAKGIAEEARAEMLLRLADLHYQQGRALRTQPALQVRAAEARPLLEEAARLYDDILRSHPRYERTDQAVFFLGCALQELGRDAEAVEAFKQLAKMYPESSFVPDAYARLGEHLFEKGNAHGALKAWQKVSSYPESPLYAYALYRVAWTYRALGERDRAIEALAKLTAHLGQTRPTEPWLSLRAEVVNALSSF